MPDLESCLAEPRIVVFQLNRIPVRLDLMWNLLWRIADEIHQRAQLWLFYAVGRLKFKAEPFNGRLAENFHGLLELGREILGHLLAALPFFEIIDERYGVAADGFFLEEVAQVYYDWHATEGTAQLVILVFLDRPSHATPMEAAIEK